MKIGIVNNGLGNVGSVSSALAFYKHNVFLANSPKDLDAADVIILAGVGHFKIAVEKIKQLNFWDKLNELALEKKKPIIGICLGMQLFADISYEGGEIEGLGWIKGKVEKIDNSSVKVPHIGWEEIKPFDDNIFKDLKYNSFYFMHSYHFIPEDKKVIKATARYGDLDIVSAVGKENIMGFQFHPEKSQGDGLRLLNNCLEACSKL